VTATLAEQKRAIQEQMELAALKQQQRVQQAQGAIGLMRGAVEAALGSATSGDASPAMVASSAAERERWRDEEEHGERPAEVAVGAGPLPMSWRHGTGGSPSPQARRGSLSS
jgi:class 3 adenylate cyclase